MVNTAIGLDATHAQAHNIPHGTFFVYGYVSGTQDIQWTSADWSMFAGSQLVRIWQGYGGWLQPGQYDECDMEKGALQPSDMPHILAARVAAGFEWTTFYGSRDYLNAIGEVAKTLPRGLWDGHANCRLADWSLNEQSAAKLIGTMIGGMTCVAVQWASDSSNPNTPVPGGTTTLSQTPMDINVVDINWRPSIAHVGPPVPVPPQPVKGALVLVDGQGNYMMRSVQSTDAEKTWH